LKISYFAFVSLLLAAISCSAQSGQSPAPEKSQTSQQTAPATEPAAGQPGDANAKPDKKGEESSTSKDRLFFALPNFLTVDKNGKIVPLTAGQKFKVVARGSFDPVQAVWYGALSGISQAENSEPGFGQGWAAYGKRYGAYAADGTIENFFVGAILPSMLHQDPRFFPTTEGGFFHRTGYAATRIVITRSDSGNRQFNFSEVVGSAMASAISTNSYHPRRTFLGVRSDGSLKYAESERTLKNTASVWGSQVGYDAITLVIKEFWPDIRRKFKK
jgi:hypothetical protein